MTIHFKLWNPHNAQWYIYCLTSDKTYQHMKDWHKPFTCPHCTDKVPAIQDLKYSRSGTSMLRIH